MHFVAKENYYIYQSISKQLQEILRFYLARARSVRMLGWSAGPWRRLVIII